MIRAVGPTLAAVPDNVPGTIADPSLVAFAGFGQRVAANDNWGSAASSPVLVAASAAAGAFPIDDNSKDAARVVTLAPGAYTARVDGISGATGPARLEVYDTDTVPLTPRLAYRNLKSSVAAGATTTLGFVIAGGSSQTVLIRGLGPALSSVVLTGTLSNPAINGFNSSSVSVASNDNWGTAAANATLATVAVTADSATVTLTAYHSADTARGGVRDGKIELLELTRVIELYNTRSGTVRTGAYRPAGGTEDGYEPVP